MIPGLKQIIVNAQKNDVKLQVMAQMVSTGDKTDFAIDGSRGLLYKNRLCVPNDMKLKRRYYMKATILFSPCILEVIKCIRI